MKQMIQTTLRLPDELHKTLKGEAGQRGMTLNAYIISVLWSRSELWQPNAEKTRVQQ